MILNQASTRSFYIIFAYILSIVFLSSLINSSGYLLTGTIRQPGGILPATCSGGLLGFWRSLPRLTEDERCNTPYCNNAVAYFVPWLCQQKWPDTLRQLRTWGLHRSNAKYGDLLGFDAEMLYPCVAIAGDLQPRLGYKTELGEETTFEKSLAELRIEDEAQLPADGNTSSSILYYGDD